MPHCVFINTDKIKLAENTCCIELNIFNIEDF